MRYVDALLCVAALLCGEWLVVGLLHWSELAGPIELLTTLTSLVPFALILAVPLSVGGALLAFALERPEQPRARVLAAVPAVLLAAVVAVAVSGGRQLAGARGPIFVAVTVLVAGGVTWLAAPYVGRGLSWLRGRGWWWVVAVTLVAVVAVEWVNQTVLPRLYLPFHIGLAVLATWLAAVASLAWSVDARRRLRLGLCAGLVATSAALAPGAPERLRLFDNVRFIYVERAPILAHPLRLMGLLAPPPPIVDPDEGPKRDGPELAVDFTGRDIVLVTIDALRADHVGAYGYERATTPALDALAESGVVFEQAFTATPHTSYAVSSLMTGKYMRPLLLQGVAGDSETWADALRRYGLRTAAFYPPAVFFVDQERFEGFQRRGFGFEYRKVEFATADQRVAQVERYLAEQPADQRLFLWVHLFEPHEPYEQHPDHAFGERSIDRYDSEIAAADEGLGAIVARVRAKRPRAVVIVSADHGEEFGDHGGRYHGTTVYDEQVRVPLVIDAPGLLEPRRVSAPVSLVDLMPTVLAGLGIPRSPRIRGRNLGPWLLGRGEGEGFAFAETDEQTLLAQGSLRLVCARRIGACRLYDVASDPGQRTDRAADHAETFTSMKHQLAALVSSLGRYEQGQAPWPTALRRGIAGDVEAAVDVAGLLDDADVRIRRKAAEVLFDLRRPEVAPHLRRALTREEDEETERWIALALTRLEQGASLTYDLLGDDDLRWRRLAALALAESGDRRGEGVLLAWWRRAYPEEAADAEETIPFDRAREIAQAFGRIKSEKAVGPLVWALRDVRLRRYVAEALATIGESAGRPGLAKALATERYHDARVTIARALVTLGGEIELRKPLIRFLGVPDPIAGGLEIAQDANMLRYVGGPRDRELRRLREFATSGVTVGLVVPESEHATGEGLRVLVRAKVSGGEAGEVRFGLATTVMSDGDRSQLVPKKAPNFDPALTVTIPVPADGRTRELYATLPKAVSERVEPGDHADFVVYATQSVEVASCAVVPLAAEIPPPPPEPWEPEDGRD